MRTIKTTIISILAVGLLAGSAVGVAAQDEEAAAGGTTFTGRGTFVDWIDGEQGVTPSGLESSTGGVTQYQYESSDERLNGPVTIMAATWRPAGTARTTSSSCGRTSTS